MADVTATVAAQLEQVRPILQEIFETSDQISALFKKNSKSIQNLSRYLYRIPLQQYRGGTHKKYNANEGSLGKGTGMKLTSMQAGYIYTILMYRVTDEQVDLSQNTKQSVIDVMAKTLSDGMVEASVWDDVSLHGDGTGFLTDNNYGSDTAATATMTFNTSGDNLGVSRLREGMTVDVWTANGVTKRAAATGAPIIISSVDYATNTVVLNQTVTALTAGDCIAVYDLDITLPAALTSFSAGWPATSALTSTTGLVNDSYRHGIYYAHDFTTSNYYLGKLKSSIPQLQPVSVDAKSAASLSWAHGFAFQDRIRKRRSGDVLKGMIGIFPLAQRQVVFEAGVSIATKPLSGEQFGASVDMAPTNSDYLDTFNYCNMKCYVSKRQFNNRVDFVNLKNWGRAEVFPLRPYEKQGKTVFEGRDGDGLLAAYSEFGFHSAYDFVCFDPGAEGAIINLPVPANY